MGPSRADEDKDWGKSKKFVPSADGPRRGGPGMGPGMMGDRRDGPPGREEREVRSLLLAIRSARLRCGSSCVFDFAAAECANAVSRTHHTNDRVQHLDGRRRR